MTLSRSPSFQAAARFLTAILLFAAVPAAQVGAQEQNATVALVPSTGYGIILADPDGWTLYTWDGDVEGQSNCYDACAEAWPPYTVSTELTAPPDLPGSLGLFDRGDGSWQVTFNNWPLYYFAGDVNPGDTNGDGSMGSGALWYVTAFEQPAQAAPPVSDQPAALTPDVDQSPVAGLSQPGTLPGLGAIPDNTAVGLPSQDHSFSPPGFGAPDFPGDANGPMFFPPNGGQGPFFPPPFPGQNFGPDAYQPTVSIAAPPNGTVTLNWIGNPAAQTYRVYSTLSTQPLNFSVQQTVNQLPGQFATNASIAGLTPGTLYLFQVRSVDPTGREMPVPLLAQLLPTYGSLPFGPPTNLSVASTTASSITLTWSGGSGNGYSYRIWQSNSPTGPFVASNLGTVSGTSATVTGLAPSLPYYFNITASDSSGNQSAPSFIVSANTTPSIAAPTSASVTGVTSSSATLTWAPVIGAASYQIGQAVNLSGPFAQVAIAGPSATSYTVGGLAPGSSYFFQVTAMDSAGNPSSASNTAMAATTAGQVLAPPPQTAPTSLGVTNTTTSSATLSWAGAAGAASYRLLQSSSAAGPFNPTGGVISGTTTSVTGLQPNTTYAWQIVALDSAGNQSSPSNTATATTAVPTPVTLPAPSVTVSSTASNSVVLAWSPIVGASSYWVAQSQTATGPWAPANSAASSSGATVSGLAPGTTYFFQVKAVDAVGAQGPASAAVSATTGAALTAPNVSVSGVTSTTVNLSWTPVSGASNYVVTQSQLGGFGAANVASLTNTSASITGLTPATSYSFRVMAIDSAGNQSPTSSTVIAVTTP